MNIYLEEIMETILLGAEIELNKMRLAEWIKGKEYDLYERD